MPLLEAFGIPERDRYQVVRSHPAGEIVVLDTGLGIERPPDLVILHVVSRRRGRADKERFFALLANSSDPSRRTSRSRLLPR